MFTFNLIKCENKEHKYKKNLAAQKKVSLLVSHIRTEKESTKKESLTNNNNKKIVQLQEGERRRRRD